MSGFVSERRERAFALLDRLDPQASRKVAARLDEMSHDFAELVLGFTGWRIARLPVAPVPAGPVPADRQS